MNTRTPTAHRAATGGRRYTTGATAYTRVTGGAR